MITLFLLAPVLATPWQAPKADATALAQAGKWADLEAMSLQWTKQRPESSEAWHFLGVARLRLGRAQEGIADLEHAASLPEGVGNPELAYNLCQIYAVLGQRPSFEARFNVLKIQDPERALQLLRSEGVERLRSESGTVRWLEQNEAPEMPRLPQYLVDEAIGMGRKLDYRFVVTLRKDGSVESVELLGPPLPVAGKTSEYLVKFRFPTEKNAETPLRRRFLLLPLPRGATSTVTISTH